MTATHPACSAFLAFWTKETLPLRKTHIAFLDLLATFSNSDSPCKGFPIMIGASHKTLFLCEPRAVTFSFEGLFSPAPSLFILVAVRSNKSCPNFALQQRMSPWRPFKRRTTGTKSASVSVFSSKLFRNVLDVGFCLDSCKLWSNTLWSCCC